MKSKRGKIAFVIQRYGLEVNGGSEMLCRLMAEKLNRYHDIEIITTCAITHFTWANEYPPGVQDVNNVPVRRFPVNYERDPQAFADHTRYLFVLKKEKLSPEEEIEWIKQQGPYSEELFRYVEQNKDSYDVFVFFTYLYCTTFFCLPTVKEKSIFVPTAHDEPYIRMSVFNDIFKYPKGIIFLSHEEQAFVHQLFQNQDIPYMLAGMGINFPDNIAAPGSFKQKFNIDSPYILYVGRLDPGKGLEELFKFFIRYKANTQRRLQLVLVGKNHQIEIPSHPDIRHLGFIPEEDKSSAISGAEILINSSFYESFSIVLLECWAMGTPALVNGKCDVMVGQCKRSNGGLWYQNIEEFKACLDWLLDHPDAAKQLGQNGCAYVKNNYSWDIMEQKYLSFLEKFI